MKLYKKYTVTGRGPFPLDMLRYDCCWPISVTILAASLNPENRKEEFSVEMRSNKSPTVDRWNSFGWSVEEDEW